MVIKKFESLFLDDPIRHFLRFLNQKKGDDLSIILQFLSENDSNDIYDSDKDVNFIRVCKNLNQLEFLPARYRRLYDYNFKSTNSTSVRIGRLIGKILDNIKDKLKFQLEGNFEIKNIDGNFINIDFGLNKMPEIIKKCLLINRGNIQTSITIEIENRSYYVDYYSFFRSKYSGSILAVIKYLPISNYVGPMKVSFKTNLNIKQHDIEKFVNEYISYIKVSIDDDGSKIKVVNGEQISYWYDIKNYQSNMGSLGTSCMSSSKYDFFDIYVCSENCSMLILTNQNNKLIGRALLWKTTDGYFMDRVYTSIDSVRNIFYNYAIEMGYLYRSSNTRGFDYMKDGKVTGRPLIKVEIENYKYMYYPFVDTVLACAGRWIHLHIFGRSRISSKT